ncbi:BadF/BadG/BcrA/BcrD ATPase family protein [Aestuariivirga litoralis]|uniref:BadF/BadG/BcrA/BcrD ATPase family protein n=1 Tax=Aestuariivirga litoralis TaxID=2650924 RepID=UPI0018C5B271|nr:BadF/BadG/BcrA/BcrD ATPase family protein [Aestuariivirga litoralis]MBG1233873.1 hypothetical protein [Aestuariivirga litoralis]
MQHSGPYFLGVDGGGSRCRVRIRDVSGALLSEAQGGPSNVYQDFEGGVAMVISTAQTAANRIGIPVDQLHAGLGLAGVSSSVDGARLLRESLPFASVVVENDGVAACMGAFQGEDGGILIMGTGSIGIGMVGGQRHMVGGWGFTLGDLGSGGWIGLQAAQRAALVIDKMMPSSPFIEKVMTQAGDNRIDLTQWSVSAVPRDFASLAREAFAAADAGDPHAKEIVVAGSGHISDLGKTLLSRGAKQLSLMGGLAPSYEPYLSQDIRAVLVPPKSDALDGAILMARRAQA